MNEYVIEQQLRRIADSLEKIAQAYDRPDESADATLEVVRRVLADFAGRFESAMREYEEHTEQREREQDERFALSQREHAERMRRIVAGLPDPKTS